MMKKQMIVLLSGIVASSVFAGAEKPTPAQVKALTTKVADWQIETFADSGKYR